MSAGALVPSRRNRHAGDDSDLAVGVRWALWAWRAEIVLLGVLVLGQRGLARPLGDLAALVAIALVVLAAFVARRSRHLLLRLLYAARVRRAWGRAARDSGLGNEPWSVPRALSVVPVAAGDRICVRVRRGRSIAELESRWEELAATLRARDVRVTREPTDAAEATVLVVRRDPFEEASPVRWPLGAAEELSLWDPIPLGVDEQGDTVSVVMPERNVLLGGEPGAGKSAALSLLVASAALDPTAQLWLLDGKLVELAAWAPAACRVVGTDGREAVSLLRDVQSEMDQRYRELLARGLRKVGRSDALPLHLVVCDELAFYLSLPDKRERQEFTELLRDLVARGRAAGVIVCAATQKPGSDVVPTALRDLFGFRLALRCNTPQASDTILGQGWASAGADASTIPGRQRGVGYLLAEGDRPIRVRGFYLDDDEIRAIAERAAATRADAWLAAASGDGAHDQASDAE